VTKCISLAFVWASNSRLERQLHDPKHVLYGPKINGNLAKCVLQGVCAHVGCSKKLDPSAENRVL
jgi:hypothetical protein